MDGWNERKRRKEKGKAETLVEEKADPSLGIGNGWDEDRVTTKEGGWMEDESITEEEASRENAVGELPTEFARADPSLGLKGWNDLDCKRWITLSLCYFHILSSTL